MTELIKITEHNGQRAVSARELHHVLGSKQEFANWIKSRIEKYGFIENQDYQVFDNFIKNPDGGRPLKEYALSIDMAKEIAMVEGNERGRQVRQYFIKCERELRQAALPSYQINDPIERAKRWIKEQETTKQLALENRMLTEVNKQKDEQIVMQEATIEQQAEQIKADAPKVLFSKAVETSQRSCLVSELAKILKQNGIEMGQNRLFEWLRKKGYLCKHGQMYNQPTQMAMEKGLFEIKQTTINKPDGSILVSSTTKVTGRGQIYFVNKFLNREVA